MARGTSWYGLTHRELFGDLGFTLESKVGSQYAWVEAKCTSGNTLRRKHDITAVTVMKQKHPRDDVIIDVIITLCVFRVLTGPLTLQGEGDE